MLPLIVFHLLFAFATAQLTTTTSSCRCVGRYSSNSAWYTSTVYGSSSCSQVGLANYCTAYTAATTTTAPCQCTGRYLSSSTWYTSTITGSASCSQVGLASYCSAAPTTTPVCQCTGRYISSNTWYTSTITGSASCSQVGLASYCKAPSTTPASLSAILTSSTQASSTPASSSPRSSSSTPSTTPSPSRSTASSSTPTLSSPSTSSTPSASRSPTPSSSSTPTPSTSSSTSTSSTLSRSSTPLSSSTPSRSPTLSSSSSTSTSSVPSSSSTPSRSLTPSSSSSSSTSSTPSRSPTPSSSSSTSSSSTSSRSPIPSSSSSTSSSSSSTTRSSSTSSAPATPTLVRSSGKRGLSYNDANYTDFFSLSGQNSKVSWAYNWYSQPYSDGTSSGFHPYLNFIPMLWSDAAVLTSVWATNVNNAISSNGADAVVAFNEPDVCWGNTACMSVSQSVTAWKNFMEPYHGKVLLGSPAVTNGVAPAGLTWLSQFVGNCTSCHIDFIALHWYYDCSTQTNRANLKDYVTSAYTTFGKPVWVTEFGCTSGTDENAQQLLDEMMPWLDAQAWVTRYAYFMAKPGLLINSDGTGMSAQGQIYNNYTGAA